MRKIYSSFILIIIFLPSIIFSKSTQWKISTPLAQSSYGHSAVSGNGKLFVAGGFSYKKRKTLSGVYMYHPLTGKWKKVSNMNQARGFAGAAYYNGRIYIIGGNNMKKTLGTVEIYNTSTRSWSYGASMPTPRRGFAVALHKGKIYCIGGFSIEQRKTLKAVEAYDIKSNSWEKLPDLPFARQGAAAVAANNRIFVMGGVLGTSRSKSGLVFLRDMNYFVINSKSWHKGPSMIYNRYYLSAAYHNGKIYAIGGIKGLRPVNIVEVIDLEKNNKWRVMPKLKLSTPRNAPASAILNGTIYTTGGLGYNGDLNSVEVLRVE